MTRFEQDDVARLRAALGRISRQLDRTAGSGLSRTQSSVLATVARRGPIGAGEVADIEGLNPTMLSRVLTKLEADGLLSRRPSPTDRRAVLVEATAAGQALHQRIREERARVLGDHLDALPTSRARQLYAALPALEALAEHLTAVTTTGAPEPVHA